MNTRTITSSYQMRKHRYQNRAVKVIAEKSKFSLKKSQQADDDILTERNNTKINNNVQNISSKSKDKIKKNVNASSQRRRSPRNRSLIKDTTFRFLSSQEPQSEITWNCNSPEYRTVSKSRTKPKIVSDDVFNIVKQRFIPNKDKNSTNNLLALWRAPHSTNEPQVLHSATTLKSTGLATKCKGIVEEELNHLINQVGIPLDSHSNSSSINGVECGTTANREDSSSTDKGEDVWEDDEMFNDEEFIKQTQELISKHTISESQLYGNPTAAKQVMECTAPNVVDPLFVKESYGIADTLPIASGSASIASGVEDHDAVMFDDDILSLSTQPLFSVDDVQPNEQVANDPLTSNVPLSKTNIQLNKRTCLSPEEKRLTTVVSPKHSTLLPRSNSFIEPIIPDKSSCQDLWDADDGFDEIMCSIKCETANDSCVDSIFTCDTQVYPEREISSNNFCDIELQHPFSKKRQIRATAGDERYLPTTNHPFLKHQPTSAPKLSVNPGLAFDKASKDKGYRHIPSRHSSLKINTSQVDTIRNNIATTYSLTNALTVQHRCTEEEIERKRLEAIERRRKAVAKR